MNWIDRAVGYVFPEHGLRRAQARHALGLVRAYDAAKNTRRTDGWKATGSSANVEIAGGVTTVRNRARELVRNNPHANIALRTLSAKKIGTGIRARPDKGAAGPWKEFVETCDYEGDLDLYGIQTQLARTADESGEVLLRRIRLKEGRVPLQLQVLEPDYIDSTKFGPAGENFVIAGIEINRQGRRQALWLYDQHPGESLLLPRPLESKRVPWSEVIHLYEKDRPGQLRGISRFSAAMLRMRDHDDWRDAVIMKKKIEACFAAFVVGGNPSLPLGQASTDNTDATAPKRIEQLSPGLIQYVENGTDVKFANPTASVDGAFSKEELHAIAVGSGVTYEQLTGDLSEVNFSSIRTGINNFRDLVDAWRWIYFMPMAMRRVQQWFLEAAWTAGSVRTMNYGFIWTPPAWPYVQPLDDIKAIKEEVRGGLSSLSEKIRARGDDPDEVFAELKAEREALKKDGTVVDTDAAVEANAAAQPATEPDADPAKKDKGAEDRALLHELASAVMAQAQKPAAPIHVDARATFEAGALQVHAPTTIAEGAVQAPTTIAAGAVQVHAPTTIAEGAVQAPTTIASGAVSVRAYPSQSTESIERDVNNEMTRVTRVNKD